MIDSITFRTISAPKVTAGGGDSNRFCIVQSPSGSWFLIPISKRAAWAYVKTRKGADPIVPHYATPIHSPFSLTFSDPKVIS